MHLCPVLSILCLVQWSPFPSLKSLANDLEMSSVIMSSYVPVSAKELLWSMTLEEFAGMTNQCKTKNPNMRCLGPCTPTPPLPRLTPFSLVRM